jgi:hypothetical protein
MVQMTKAAGRTRKEIMASLSPADRAAVEARTAELHAEVEGLKALRMLTKSSSPKAWASSSPLSSRSSARPTSISPPYAGS